MVLEALAVALLAHYSLKSAMKSFFIDVNDDVIHLINKEKTYPQIIMKRGTTCSLDQKYPCCGWKRP